MTHLELNVSGMTCGGCEKSVRNALLNKDGVHEVVASHKTGIVAIDFDSDRIRPDMLQQAIEAAGFEIAA